MEDKSLLTTAIEQNILKYFNKIGWTNPIRY